MLKNDKLIEIIKKSIETNEKRLMDYYEDENDTRNECDKEIEQIRTNILNLKILYVKLTTDITDRDELVDMASNM